MVVTDTVRRRLFQDFPSTIKIQHTKGYVEFFKLLPTFFYKKFIRDL
jgi:hypothetical protein